MTSRLVAIGKIRAPYRMIDLTVSFREPLWKPQIAHDAELIVDYDLIRKVDLESREDDI